MSQVLQVHKRRLPDGEVRYYYPEGTPRPQGGVVINWAQSTYLLISRTVAPHRASKVAIEEHPLCFGLFFPEGGPMDLMLAGKRMTVHPHEYGVANLDQPYAVQTVPQNMVTHRMLVYVSLPFLSEVWEEVAEQPPRPLPKFQDGVKPRGPYLQSLVRLLFRESTHAASPWLSPEMILRHLVHWLFRSHELRGETNMGDLLLPPIDDPRVELALNHLRSHYTDRGVIADAAAAAGLHANTLTAKFRQALGLSPQEYLARVRMDRARALLGETTLPVSEISASVGFESPSHFAHAFVKTTGLTPSKFRSKSRAVT